MVRQSTRTVVTVAAIALTALGLSGCGFGGGGSSTATTVSATPTTSTVGPSAAAPADRLAVDACHEYAAAVANPSQQAGYSELFDAAAEAESAASLSSGWAQLSGVFQTVKTEIGQIDQLQTGGSYSNTASDAGTLSQALGTLKGDLTAVATLCAADRI